MMNKKRPKHLALHKIKLPLPGLVSILHRVSGLFLFFSLPLMLWVLHMSLRSTETFSKLVILLHHPFSKLIVLVLAWSFFHHFCAGIRYLALDLHIGSTLKQARTSSWIVLGISLLLTILLGIKIC